MIDILATVALLGAEPIDSPDRYLCEVYHRTPVKQDAAGDFSWKDAAAAQRRKMEVCEYVVGGLNPNLKKALEWFGKKADEVGLQWSFSSGFRDDFRQSIASGIKARTGFSMHGGSRVTKGYGDGRAVDLSAAGALHPVIKLMDTIGSKIGLVRPFPGFDPMHVQLQWGGEEFKIVRKTKRYKRRPHGRRLARSK